MALRRNTDHPAAKNINVEHHDEPAGVLRSVQGQKPGYKTDLPPKG
jgi:hypothetical protein